MDFDKLADLSLEDLRAMRRKVDAAISSFEKRRRDAARAAVEEVARAHGMKLSDLLDGGESGKSRASGLPAKYANPDNPAETWSGRGRHPAWVKAQIEGGASLEDLAI